MPTFSTQIRNKMTYEYFINMSIGQLIPYFITQTIVVVMMAALPLGIVYWIYRLIKDYR